MEILQWPTKPLLVTKDANVVTNAGNALIDRIKGVVKQITPWSNGLAERLWCVLSQKYRKLILVSDTDGVRTRLRLAMYLKRHDTIGMDLVAMCINDLMVQGTDQLTNCFSSIILLYHR